MDNIEIDLGSDKRGQDAVQSKPQKDIPAKIEADAPPPRSSAMDKVDIRKSSRPLVCVAHLIFKLAALVM